VEKKPDLPGSGDGLSDHSAEQWPPPQPKMEHGEAWSSFARRFAEHLDSLLRLLEHRDSLAPAPRARLTEELPSTIRAADQHLQSLQSAINQALAAKDLTGMKSLSSSMNNLYDRLQLLRSRLPALEGAMTSSSAEAKDAPEIEDTLVLPAPPSKSELTLAAEARRMAQRTERSRPPVAVFKTISVQDPLKARRFLPPLWLLLSLATVILAIALFRIYQQHPKRPLRQQVVRSQNRAPTMRQAILEQAPTGVVVRPRAEDADGDRVSFFIRWRINGKDTGERSARLPPQYYKVGDSIQASVTPSDGLAVGSPLVSTVLKVKPSR
jgi:hypothetical protein